MRHFCWLILGLVVAAAFFAGCTDEEPPSPPPVSTGIVQSGSLIQTVGNITGQGVILQGVPRGTIDTITFTIGLAPGTKSLDLNGTTLAYADSLRTEILTPVEGYFGEPPPGYWGIIKTVNELGVRNLRMDYEEQFVIRANPKAPVSSGETFTISVKPPDGKPLLLRLVAPSVIEAQEIPLTGA